VDLILHQSDPITASEERDSDHLLSREAVNNNKYPIWCHHSTGIIGVWKHSNSWGTGLNAKRPS